MATKIEEKVSDSRAGRLATIKKFGFVPTSVLKLSRGKLSRSMFTMQRERPERRGGTLANYDKTNEHRKPTDPEKLKEWEEIRGLGPHARYKGNPTHDNQALSIMPAELVDFFVKFYSEPGATYLDPFAGQGIQMQVAALRGMSYHGYDLSTEFVEYINAIKPKLKPAKGMSIQITHGDSKHPGEVEDDSGDFSFHSPPYWDIEYYGDEAEQLGHGNTYEDFLQGMQDVAAAWLPKFKQGAFHVVNVNDFRRGGKFYPYSSDTIRLFTAAGWVLHDTWIVEGLVGGLSKVFAAQHTQTKVSAKVHEYCHVFRKP